MNHLGFPYPAIDPLAFLVDEEIRPFEDDQRQDLTGTGAQACPILSEGLFIVHQHTVPENTAEVILNVFPHVWARTNIGAPAESVVPLDPKVCAGFVLFDVTKDINQPYLVSHNYNSPTLAANPNNTDRQTVRGNTWLSADQPILMNVGMRNPLSTIYLPAKSVLRVIFRLAPIASANPIPTTLVIGGAAAPADNRIDFAGALVSGLRMPQQTYEKLLIARRKGKLGPEGSSSQDPIGVQRGF